MDLSHLSVGFEQPPKLLVRHLRTQVSNKEVFHDVSPTGNFLIVGSCRAIRQEDEREDEVERVASPCFCLSAPPSYPSMPSAPRRAPKNLRTESEHCTKSGH